MYNYFRPSKMNANNTGCWLQTGSPRHVVELSLSLKGHPFWVALLGSCCAEDLIEPLFGKLHHE